MRTGEVFALTWDDIDLKNRTIKITKTVYAKDKSKEGRWYIGTTKTEGSCREVYIRYPFKIIKKELGINARFYDLRGSFATTSLRNGCEIKDIAEVLEHKRIETTEKYYIASTKDDKKEVTKSFERSLNFTKNNI